MTVTKNFLVFIFSFGIVFNQSSDRFISFKIEEKRALFPKESEAHNLSYYMALLTLENKQYAKSFKEFNKAFDKGYFFSLWPTHLNKIGGSTPTCEGQTSNHPAGGAGNPVLGFFPEYLRTSDPPEKLGVNWRLR